MLIYTNQSSKKKARKPNAKQRALKASWQALLDKYDIKPSVRKPTRMASAPSHAVVIDPSRSTNHIPSLDTGKGIAAKKRNYSVYWKCNDRYRPAAQIKCSSYLQSRRCSRY